MTAVATQDPARWNGEWRPLNLSESPGRGCKTSPASVARPSGACWEMGQARGGKLANSLDWAVPQQQDLRERTLQAVTRTKDATGHASVGGV